jgi:N6-L-threonylcarbamoyladenine synthase
VVPELASRDHIRRLPLLLRELLEATGLAMGDIDAYCLYAGPGLAGALLVGSSVAEALGVALGVPTVPVHHLEGHLLSPLLSATPPEFPFCGPAGLWRTYPVDARCRRGRLHPARRDRG